MQRLIEDKFVTFIRNIGTRAVVLAGMKSRPLVGGYLLSISDKHYYAYQYVGV